MDAIEPPKLQPATRAWWARPAMAWIAAASVALGAVLWLTDFAGPLPCDILAGSCDETTMHRHTGKQWLPEVIGTTLLWFGGPLLLSLGGRFQPRRTIGTLWLLMVPWAAFIIDMNTEVFDGTPGRGFQAASLIVLGAGAATLAALGIQAWRQAAFKQVALANV